MDKKLTDFYFWAAGYLLLVGAVITYSTSNTTVLLEEVVVAPVELLCFNIETSELRTSNTDLGCLVPEEPLGTTPIFQTEVRPAELDRTFEVRFLAAQAAAKTVGFMLNITSGFRTQGLQARLFADAIKKYGSAEEASKWVLPKDVSNHPWGIAIDVNYPGDKIAAKWLEDNGAKFGLCRVYENEWWHFEPVIAPGQICPPMMANALESLPTLDMADIK
jgi:hypothetical protein